jgi:hypothetical protein
MEIIKITLERMSQVLPQTVKDSDLSKNAKKVLATIINYHLVNDKVRTTGFLAINNESLRQSAGIGKEYLRAAVQELIECRLIERKAGSKWKEGEPRTASEYRLVKENLTKPIKKPTSDDLLELLFSTPSKPLCTGDSPTNTNTTTDTNTETDTYSESETNTDSETGTNPSTYSDVVEEKLFSENVKKKVTDVDKAKERIREELEAVQDFTQLSSTGTLLRNYVRNDCEIPGLEEYLNNAIQETVSSIKTSSM